MLKVLTLALAFTFFVCKAHASDIAKCISIGYERSADVQPAEAEVQKLKTIPTQKVKKVHISSAFVDEGQSEFANAELAYNRLIFLKELLVEKYKIAALLISISAALQTNDNSAQVCYEY